MLRKEITLADPYITEEDIEAVTEAVKNKRLSQGEYVDRFEREFANYLKRKHALAVMNGTAALHLAVLATGLKPGDEVIVPSFTFIASANCVLYVGAKPVFVDIDPDTYNVDPEKVEKVISPRTKAIIVVHYAGQPADMDPLSEIAEKYSLHIIEDAAEAHGATYRNHKAGAMGEVGCFSFYPNKNMTTGEGGMLVTNDEQIAEKIRLLRSHGQDERYHHIILGYNFRMTDIQAALGIVQLRRLDWVIEKKNRAADYYRELLSNIDDIQPPYVMPLVTHAYMLYTIKFSKNKERDKIMQHLNTVGIETRIAFPPIHLQPLFGSLYGYKKGYLPVTEECAEKVLSLPMFPHIRKEDQGFIVNSIIEGLKT